MTWKVHLDLLLVGVTLSTRTQEIISNTVMIIMLSVFFSLFSFSFSATLIVSNPYHALNCINRHHLHLYQHHRHVVQHHVMFLSWSSSKWYLRVCTLFIQKHLWNCCPHLQLSVHIPKLKKTSDILNIWEREIVQTLYISRRLQTRKLQFIFQSYSAKNESTVSPYSLPFSSNPWWEQPSNTLTRT